MLSIDEVQEALDKIAEELPMEFYKELNGGIILLPEARMSEDALADDLFTLGRYIVSHSMGRYIEIYYGSFERIFGENVSDEKLISEMRKTLLHEFTHHLESLAGERDLEKEDERNLRRYRARAMRHL